MKTIQAPGKILLYLLLIWLNGLTTAQAQVCDGNLGDNIFESGDFGTGPTNDITTDPGIAPGYGYVAPGPPQDGLYTITKNTGAWPGLFTTWLAVTDNSPDNDGYMMVVNASFDPGLFYSQEVTGLCENTIYEFSVDVLNMIKSNIGGHIKPNVSFLLDGVTQFSTGDVPQNEQWNNYGFTFETAPGQTSLVLSLSNNAPGGTGNDLALDNISFRACGDEALILPETLVNICEDGDALTLEATVVGDNYVDPNYQWQESFDQGLTWQNIPGANGATYDHAQLASGDYYYRYLLADSPANLNNDKCRVNSNVKIVRVLPKETSFADTICTGLTYDYGGESFSQTATGVDTLQNFLGCDSIVTLQLEVVPDNGIALTLDIVPPRCSGGDADTTGSIEILQTQNGYPLYLYAVNGEDFGPGTFFGNLPGGSTYTVLVVDRFGCTADTTLTLVPPDFLSLDAGPDQEIGLGESIPLAADLNFSPVNLVWSNGDSILCMGVEDCLSFEALPVRSQIITVMATDERNCTVTDELFVRVFPERQVYVPNAFSPDANGINDRFFVQIGQPNVQQVESLRVFDRWGSSVFESTGSQSGGNTGGWDGTIGGEPAPVGVYVWTARIRFLDGTVLDYSGDVLLVR